MANKHKSEAIQPSPAEVAAFERRVARAYAHGVNKEDMQRRFSMGWAGILRIVKKFPAVKLRGQDRGEASR